MYGSGNGTGIGVGTTAAAAIVLPNTGSHAWLTALAVVSLLVGLAITATSVVRLVASRKA